MGKSVAALRARRAFLRKGGAAERHEKPGSTKVMPGYEGSAARSDVVEAPPGIEPGKASP